MALPIPPTTNPTGIAAGALIRDAERLSPITLPVLFNRVVADWSARVATGQTQRGVAIAACCLVFKALPISDFATQWAVLVVVADARPEAISTRWPRIASGSITDLVNIYRFWATTPPPYPANFRAYVRQLCAPRVIFNVPPVRPTLEELTHLRRGYRRLYNEL